MRQPSSRTRKKEESAAGRRARKERHSIKAGIQLCLLIDKQVAGDRGHLLGREQQSQVTRYQKTGQNPLPLKGGEMFPLPPPLPWVGERGRWQPGQALGYSLVRAGAFQ